MVIAGAAIKYGPLIQKDGILIAEKKVRDVRYRLISGTEALAVAAVLAGCRFMTATSGGGFAMMVEAINHPGLSIVEVIQSCLTWGTHPVSWYRERVYTLGDDYDPTDRKAALETTMEMEERITTGILFRTLPRKPFADRFRKEITDRLFAEKQITDQNNV